MIDSPPQPLGRRRRNLERLWICGTLLYGVLRIVIVRVALAEYGVRWEIFAPIEMLSSGLYGLATARLLGALIDRARWHAVGWGAMAAAMFVAPDVYVVAAGGPRLPHVAYLIIAGLVIVLGAAAIIHLRRALAAARRLNQ